MLASFATAHFGEKRLLERFANIVVVFLLCMLICGQASVQKAHVKSAQQANQYYTCASHNYHWYSQILTTLLFIIEDLQIYYK